jgi:hypothetical protein
MALKIGFARKYYTVWDYSVTYRTDARGVNYKTEHYVFLRNASMNKEKALAKYPEAEYCEDLRGRTRSWDYEKRIIEPNKFHVGKYSGILFAACTDYNYMMWFYNNCATTEQMENIAAVCVPEGYEVITYTSTNVKQMISPEDVKARKEQEEREMQGKARLEKGIPFVVTMEKNLNDMGEYFINDLEITLRFEKYKPGYYRDMVWAYPIDKKGNAKRVKNKQILIDKYEFPGNNIAIVKEWRFA